MNPSTTRTKELVKNVLLHVPIVNPPETTNVLNVPEKLTYKTENVSPNVKTEPIQKETNVTNVMILVLLVLVHLNLNVPLVKNLPT